MPGWPMKGHKVRLIGVGILMLITGLSCQLTSPRPASWAGTPTAEARSTQIALTQAAQAGPGTFVFTPTSSPTEVVATPTPTPTATPEPVENGPWLVFPAPDGDGLQTYDLASGVVGAINLPEPVIIEDLVSGLSPDGRTLILRAGSYLNTDELALYQIDLPAFEAHSLTPLLSIPVQRKIINQEGDLVFDTLAAVTRPDGLAWSPEGRFLAFNAALHNETSDFYALDTRNDRIIRLNGLLSQNASPFWSPQDDWLISQELNKDPETDRWRAELVTGMSVLRFDNQNTLYRPPANSQEEVFVGWLNPNTFMSYSQTNTGPQQLRQVNLENGPQAKLIIDGSFHEVAFDPATGVLAYILRYEDAIPQDLSGGIYRLMPHSPVRILQSTGYWDAIRWDSGGMFVASGSQGVTLFTPDGDSLLVPNISNASVSPNGNWLIGYGDGSRSDAGARLYQTGSNHPLQTLITTPVDALFWQPDSQGFLILSEGILYHHTFPRLSPNELMSGLPQDANFELIWVE